MHNLHWVKIRSHLVVILHAVHMSRWVLSAMAMHHSVVIHNVMHVIDMTRHISDIAWIRITMSLHVIDMILHIVRHVILVILCLVLVISPLIARLRKRWRWMRWRCNWTIQLDWLR